MIDHDTADALAGVDHDTIRPLADVLPRVEEPEDHPDQVTTGPIDITVPTGYTIDPIKQLWALQDIANERLRQERLKAEGKFLYSCADRVSDHYRFAILGEEVGEIAKAINEGDTEGLRSELIQVAAVCVAWLESMV